MIGREYFVRQATTLLRMARVADDVTVAGSLAGKAADIKSYLDEDAADRADGWRAFGEVDEAALAMFAPSRETFKSRAAECRSIAETILDGEAREQMLAIAEDYERAALQAEPREADGGAAMK
jgi:hypothetical protein